MISIFNVIYSLFLLNKNNFFTVQTEVFMVAGAPRKISFLPEEMILLGQEMVKWIEERQDKVLHLSQWYTIEKMFTYKQGKNSFPIMKKPLSL